MRYKVDASNSVQLYFPAHSYVLTFLAIKAPSNFNTYTYIPVYDFLFSFFSRATYSGMAKPERGVLHYLDMATTRLILWQTTVFRYIAEYTVHGQVGGKAASHACCKSMKGKSLPVIFQDQLFYIQ